MKKIIKSCLFILTFALVLTTMVFKANAANYTVIINSKTNVETKEVIPGLTYKHDVINSSFGNNVALDREVYTYTMDKDAPAFVATWSYSNSTDYTLKPLTSIAEDYERNHPGYVVLAGINAEGFNVLGDEKEITGPFIQDGDVIRKDVDAAAYRECIAWFEDGSHMVKRVPTVDSFMTLTNITKDTTAQIETINNLPTEGGIGLITEALKKELDLTGYHVYKGVYDLYRHSRTFPGGPTAVLSGLNYGIFVKGAISEEVNLATISKCDQRYFYLISKNAIALEKDDAVKAEYKYNDEFKDAVSMTTVWFRYIRNGVVPTPDYYQDWSDLYEQGLIPADDSFTYGQHDYLSTTGKQRAGFGYKADGSLVLICSNTGIGGPSAYEVGHYLQDMDVVDGYLVDNGGSSTIIRRTETGKFEMINEPADGHPRSLSTGLFIVMKVPTAKAKTTRDTATFTVDPTSCAGLENISLHINNKTYPVNGSDIVVEGLKENTAYDYYFTFTNNGKQATSPKQSVTTDGFKKPSIFVLTKDINGNEITLNYRTDDGAYEVIYVKVSCPQIDETIVFDGPTISFTGLNLNTKYDFIVEFQVRETATGNVYTYDSDTFDATTIGYIKPKISTFEHTYDELTGKFTLEYKISDPEKSGTYKLYVDGVATDLTKSRDTFKQTFDTSEDHEVYIEITYNGTKTIMSEIIDLPKASSEGPKDPSEDKPSKPASGCSFGAYAASMVAGLALVAIILKKKH